MMEAVCNEIVITDTGSKVEKELIKRRGAGEGCSDRS